VQQFDCRRALPNPLRCASAVPGRCVQDQLLTNLMTHSVTGTIGSSIRL
jgi:hypothetical protein